MTFAGKDAERYLKFLQQKVGIFPIPDLGNKLDDYFFRLKLCEGGDHGRMVAAAICFGTGEWKENQTRKSTSFCQNRDASPTSGPDRSP